MTRPATAAQASTTPLTTTTSSPSSVFRIFSRFYLFLLGVGQIFDDLHYPILVTKTDIENRLVPNNAEALKIAVCAIKIEPVTFLDIGKFDENMVHIWWSLIVRNYNYGDWQSLPKPRDCGG
jgi:hypothetical protein